MENITIDSRLLKSMLAAAPKHDIRYYLNGVHLRRGIIEVTNGHYMLRAKLEGNRENLIFNLIGNIPARARETVLDLKSSCATHRDKDFKILGMSYIQVIDGKFPDVDRIVNGFKTKNVSSGSFNPEYVGLPFKLFGAYQARFEFGGTEASSRVLFKSRTGDDIEMYIMPMRE